jgi:sugar transferase (PEP-CTERM/EpsH1 system associated)
MAQHPPTVVHIVYRFDLGGMQLGLLRLLNNTPAARLRHVVVSITDGGDIRKQLRDPSTPVISLGLKRLDYTSYVAVSKLLRELRPAIVHTRNLGTIEAHVSAMLAGVSVRIHGEHGRDVYDLDGRSRRYGLLRKLLRPLITHYTVVSQDLKDWLVKDLGIPLDRVTRIYNGVDSSQFRLEPCKAAIGPPGFIGPGSVVIGTVGRMLAVKDQSTLTRAFIRILQDRPDLRSVIRLVMLGDGPVRETCLDMLREAGALELAWLPGECANVSDLLRGFDIFALPSLGEGLCNAILEAMATGLPTVATNVGGNPELVREGVTGYLVPRASPDDLANALIQYIDDPQKRALHGRRARQVVERCFGIESMVASYLDLYDSLLGAS